MEPEGSLPYSQEPSTGPCPEQNQSMPSHPISLKLILILPTHRPLGLPNGLFPSDFLSDILYTFLFSTIRATFPVHLILLDLSTSYEAPHYAVSAFETKQKKFICYVQINVRLILIKFYIGGTSTNASNNIRCYEVRSKGILYFIQALE
jgi:fumarate reductase subunit D